ncbi:MAG: nicotinate-nucleotide adenylyltransferase [Acidobacteriaceae bacterium]|nr:nicotinate-nucleotide adenylyltransferase [Acidobacteriaceae bacterium]
MRIALFGGTFDPPHCGHIAIAQAAADAFQLDRVLFTPAGRQPLKPNATYASFADRLGMVELAVQADARFAVSTLDEPLADGSANYTVDTLATLADGLNSGDQLFCITGADAFLDLHRWREPERLLTLAEWIVVSRPGFPMESLAKLTLLPPEFARVHLLETVHQNVSATRLREAIAAGLNVDADLPPGVGLYIRQQHLYI